MFLYFVSLHESENTVNSHEEKTFCHVFMDKVFHKSELESESKINFISTAGWTKEAI